jgi:hypothetical protein
MKRFYNNTLGANTLKTTVMGAGIGGMMGTMGYKEDKDDGSFGRSRLGGMATGMLAGAGAGLATGLAFKPIKGVPKAPKPQAPNPVPDKVAEYMDVIYGEAMEKKAANPITTIARGATDAYEDFKKLDEVTRVAIGSSIGGTIGVLTGLQQQKGKNDKKFLAKAKDVGKAGFEGALMGAAVTGMIGYKPGDIKRDIQEIFKQGR